MQIPDEIRKCVVFICYKAIDGIKLAGTAFFMGVQLEIPGPEVIYLITARHIIEEIKKQSIDQKVYLRMNLKNEPAKLVGTQIERWKLHPKESNIESNIDVAVLSWAPSPDIYDYRVGSTSISVKL